jgi:hypothetical protein
MALFTKKDFAALCGIKTNQLSVSISRGNVILSGELIDENDAKNANFLQRHREKVLKAPAVTEPSPTKENKKPANVALESDVPPITTGKTKPKKTGLSQYEIDLQIKRADLEKKEVDTRIALLKEEKMLGASIPTDLVKSVIGNLSKSMVSWFKDGADHFIIEISKRKSLTNEESAQLKGVLVEIINTSSSKAIAECRKNLKSIINDYSTKKEVGEHE